jgi:hypothetical protein
MTALQERTGGNEVAEKLAGQPICAATLQLRRDMVPRRADFFQLLGQRQGQLVLAPAQMKHPLAQEHLPEALGPINLLGQRARSGEGFAHLGRRKAFGGKQCPSKRELQVQLLLPAPRSVRQAVQRVQSLPQLGGRFGRRRARERLPTGLEPISDRLLRQPGFRKVPGKQRRLGHRDVRELVFKRCGNAGVYLLAAAAQQRALGEKRIDRIRWLKRIL